MDKINRPFKQKYSFQARKQLVRSHATVSKDHVLVIIERSPQSRLTNLMHRKFQCNLKLTFGQFTMLVHNKLKHIGILTQQNKKSLLLYVGNTVPLPQTLMTDVYNRYKEEDGLLYIRYQQMETFGGF